MEIELSPEQDSGKRSMKYHENTNVVELEDDIWVWKKIQNWWERIGLEGHLEMEIADHTQNSLGPCDESKFRSRKPGFRSMRPIW